MTYQSALPICGDTVYWEDTVAGHGSFDGIVERCNNAGVLVSMPRGDGVRFVFVEYESIVKVVRAVKEEK